MRYITLLLLLGGLLCAVPLRAMASVVDATAAEAAYKSGDYAAATAGFSAAVDRVPRGQQGLRRLPRLPRGDVPL